MCRRICRGLRIFSKPSSVVCLDRRLVHFSNIYWNCFSKSPSHDPELPSLVYVGSDEAVGGFLGVIPLRMSFRGKPIRAALGSSLMVEKAKDNPFAGAALLKAFLDGAQELSFTDTANPISAAMWKKLGGQLLPVESMQWLRVLRPAGLALSLLEERISLVKVARPICMAIDRVATPNRFRLKAKVAAHTIDVDLNDHFLIDYLRDFAAQYSLGPIWDTDSLRWRLNHAAQNRRRGKLVCRAVYGKATLPFWLLLVLSSTSRRSSCPSTNDIAERSGNCFG